MKKQLVSIGVLSLAFLLLLAVMLSVRPSVGTAWAQEPNAGGDTPLTGDEAEAAVTDEIPIQGRLTDAGGNPINGTRAITFTLYTSSIGGTELCQDTDDVTVVNGLFSARMGYCTASDINGRQLYLGIQAAGDPEMADRLAILPVPYAYSLRPGAIISGTVADAATLQVDNWATDGRGLRGYARAASGVNYGVLGRSWSPNGYGGYFGNDGGGYALGVEGSMRMSVNAGGAKTIDVGDRYRDNAIVAWAKLLGTGIGSIQSEFGVDSVDHYNTGCYKIYLDIDATSTAALIPMAIAEIDTAPTSAGEIRIVSVNQIAVNIFNVYINNGNGSLVDNDFVFMVTAR
jgi:hypothetical protein